MGYPKQVYDRAWASLSQRREAARELTRRRRDDVRAAIPETIEMERKLAALGSSVARGIVASPDKAEEMTAQLARESLALQEARRKLLEKHGFDRDYLEEQYGCAACRDNGYIGARMCDCFRALLRREAAALLSASSPSEQCGFGSFSLDYYPREAADASGIIPYSRMKDVLDTCVRYAETFTPGSDSLLFIGMTGLGKTHLSVAIASAVTDAGYGVVYTPVQRLMETLEAEKFGRGERGAENTRFILDCDLLVLDDLGAEFSTQFSVSMLYNIVNTRMVEQRPTIISTNLSLQAIEEKYSQRMVSRLVCGYQVLKFYGKDIRFIKKARSLR